MKAAKTYAKSKARRILESWWEAQRATGTKQAEVADYLKVGRNNMSHWFSPKSSANVLAGKAGQIEPLPLDRALKLANRYKDFPLKEYLAALYRFKKAESGGESDEMVAAYEATMAVLDDDRTLARVALDYEAVLKIAIEEESAHVSRFAFPKQLSDEQADRVRQALRSVLDDLVEEHQLELQVEGDVDTSELEAKAMRVLTNIRAKKRVARSWGVSLSA